MDFDFILNMIEVQSPYGVVKKKNLSPYKKGDEEKLIAEYDKIEKFVEAIKMHREIFVKTNALLSHFKDISLIVEQIEAKKTLSVTELFEVKYFVFTLKLLYNYIGENKYFKDFNITRMLEVEKLLDPNNSGVHTFYIYSSYSKEIKEYREQIEKINKQIKILKNEVKSKLNEKYNVKINHNDEIVVPKSNKELIDSLISEKDLKRSCETLMHYTFSVNYSEEFESLSFKLQDYKLKEEQEDERIRKDLSTKLRVYVNQFLEAFDKLATLDLILAKSHLARKYNMIRPKLGKGIKIENGVHLKVSDYLNKNNLEFQKISIEILNGVTLITGANMGGKTICLKLVAQMQAMAQYGLFVPCDSYEFELLDYIFLSSIDAQDIDKGLSTFGGEMKTIASVIKEADRPGLILIDELARGTNPKEGFAISRAIVKYLSKKPAITLLTTHFDCIGCELDVLHLQVVGLSNANSEELEFSLKNNDIDIINRFMDYRLKKVNIGDEVPKEAIKISKMMGVNKEILDEAKRILQEDVWTAN